MEKDEIFLYEEKKLKKVIDLINRQIKEAEENFKKQQNTIIGFTEGMRGTQFTRQSFMSFYATEIEKLKVALPNPYFGMFEFKSDDDIKEIYLGTRTITDDNKKIIVYDWRKPICSMYYDYNIGSASYTATNGKKQDGEILKKRQIIIKNGKLQYVAEQDVLTDDSVLLKYLQENSDSRLKSIIATIQKEQNMIIRSPFDKDYIIQGTAGSGKTTVALHRIAYLLYNESKKVNESDFVILGPNKYFLNYISDLLPNLDIKNVSQITFDEIALNNTGISKSKLESKNKILQDILSNKIDEKIIRYKSSIEFLKFVENFVKIYVNNHIKDDIMYEGISICKFKEIKDYFNNSILTKGKSYKEQANVMIKKITKRVKENYDDISHNVWSKYRDEYLSLAKGDPRRNEILDKVNAIEKEIKKGCPKAIKDYFKFLNISPFNLYQALIENLEIIGSNNFDDFKLLQDYTNLNLSKKQIGYEDLTPLLLINYMMKGGDNFNDCSHLIIDEAQDLSLAQYYILKKIFPNAKFNIFGDINQSIYDYQSVHDWDELNGIIFESKADVLNLDKSYRMTMNIFDASNLILQQLNSNDYKCISREGDKLKLSGDISISNIILQIKSFIDKGYESIAVICKDADETRTVYNQLKKNGLNITEINEKNEQYSGGICIMPSYLSKGLEFDAVIIYDANSEKYSDSNIDIKLLYVAITRAMHDLCINYNGELSLCIKPLIENNKVLKKTKSK